MQTINPLMPLSAVTQFINPPLLPLPAVIQFTTLSRATVYRRVKDGTFPRPVRIGINRIAWRYEDVKKWLDGCMAIGGEVLQ